MPQGRFLEYLDELERADKRRQLTFASYVGMAMAGGEESERAWSELWESTMTHDEIEAHYARGREELDRRSE